MKPPCRRLRWLIPLALLALPPVLWALALLILPTDWARGRIAARLSQSSGRSVHLDALRVGFFGGVTLKRLSIGAPLSGGDPWLTVSDAQLNVNLLHLLTGHIDPTEIRVDRISLRVRRRLDGTFELSDLLEATPEDSSTTAGGADCPGPTRLDVVISNSSIEVIDEPSQTRLEFAGIDGRASCVGRHASIQQLKGTVSGGTFEMVGQLDRTTGLTSFEGQIRAENVTLGDEMSALEYLLAPIVSGSKGKVDGKLALNLYLRGHGATREAIQKSLVGSGGVVLDPVKLTNSKLLTELAPLLELAPEDQAASVRTSFTISKRRINTEDLTLSVGRIPVVLAGWTTFDGALSYRLRSESLTGRLPSKAREFLADMNVNLDELASLRIQGTFDNVIVTLDDAPLGDRSKRLDDRQRYRELGRKLKDRILR